MAFQVEISGKKGQSVGQRGKVWGKGAKCGAKGQRVHSARAVY